MADGIGYPSLAENWNAVEMMQELSGDFAPGAAYFTIAGGYLKLPLALAAIARQAGAVHLNRRAVAVAPTTGGGVSITFAEPGGAHTIVRARRVIMTTPLEAMHQLAYRSPMLQDSTFESALGTVGPTPASKMFLGFSTPWWRALGVVGGYSITDLPAKRIWYFGPESEQPGGDPTNQHALVMLYNDVDDSAYWDGYEPARAFNGPPMPRTAPPKMVANALTQLSLVHGVSVPEPYWTGFIDWRNLPYGNGFHWWNMHARSGEVVPYLYEPFHGINLSVVCDCWSPAQNWIESGLTVTEGLLQSLYRLESPPWLPAGTGISP